MHKMLCYVFLIAGLAWTDTVLSQFPGAGVPASPYSFTPKMQKAFAWPVRPGSPGIVQSPRMGTSWAGNNTVGIMSPDRMACLIPDMKRVESMPVLHLSNINPTDRMPNALPRRKTIIARP